MEMAEHHEKQGHRERVRSIQLPAVAAPPAARHRCINPTPVGRKRRDRDGVCGSRPCCYSGRVYVSSRQRPWRSLHHARPAAGYERPHPFFDPIVPGDCVGRPEAWGATGRCLVFTWIGLRALRVTMEVVPRHLVQRATHLPVSMVGIPGSPANGCRVSSGA